MSTKTYSIAPNEVLDLEESTISNAVLEQIFFRIANSKQIARYDSYEGRVDEETLKTMYASKAVKQAFTILIQYYERKQGKVFQLPE